MTGDTGGRGLQVVRCTQDPHAATGEGDRLHCEDGSVWYRLPPFAPREATGERRATLIGDRIYPK